MAVPDPRYRLRHALILTIDTELDDQTDDEAMVDVLNAYLKRAVEADYQDTGVAWPLNWQFRYLNVRLVPADPDTPSEDRNGDTEKEP